MLFKTQMTAADSNDADLVAASLSGDRDAFALIVSRYQSLICALAYNATGSLTESEDLAQETFMVAWRQLKQLREPEKVRPWLCGIARNTISNALRRNQRQPLRRAETLDSMEEIPAPDHSTSDGVIRQEEEAILWRSLEHIPEHYREPLILFYREGESVQRVAQQLDLSEDVVKQRLSRGRKMLAEAVTNFVEGALRQSAPGRAFTLGVVASLPMLATSATAATVGAGAAKGSAAASGSSAAAILASFLGPLVGLLGGYMGVRASINATRTPRERAFMIQETKSGMIGMGVFSLFLFGSIFLATSLWQKFPIIVGTAVVLLPIAYVIWLMRTVLRTNKRFREIRKEEQALHPEMYEPELLNPNAQSEYRSKRTLLGLPLVHCCNGVRIGDKCKPAVGWIALGDRAYGILFAAGAVAVGGIAMGGIAVGLIAFGGLAVGAIAIAGLAFGGIAVGGIAVGVIASGGIAIAWLAAQGGLAGAATYALGGKVIAVHANDATAREFFRNIPWLDLQNAKNRNMFIMLNWSPMLLFIWFLTGRKRKRRGSS